MLKQLPKALACITLALFIFGSCQRDEVLTDQQLAQNQVIGLWNMYSFTLDGEEEIGDDNSIQFSFEPLIDDVAKAEIIVRVEDFEPEITLANYTISPDGEDLLMQIIDGEDLAETIEFTLLVDEDDIRLESTYDAERYIFVGEKIE